MRTSQREVKSATTGNMIPGLNTKQRKVDPRFSVSGVREKNPTVLMFEILCGCKKMYFSVCTRLCMHVCVFLNILILPAKIILQPSLISPCLCIRRKRKLVSPPPLLFLLSFYSLLHKCVSVHVCKRKHADVCALKVFT